MSRMNTMLMTKNPYLSLHICMVAMIVTGIFITQTASDLGPFSPMLISIGIYAVFFGLCAEILYWLRYLVACLVSKRIKEE